MSDEEKYLDKDKWLIRRFRDFMLNFLPGEEVELNWYDLDDLVQASSENLGEDIPDDWPQFLFDEDDDAD